MLIDIDLNSKLRNQILVERENFAFFAAIEYEKLPEFYTICQNIGHSLINCKRNVNMAQDADGMKPKKPLLNMFQRTLWM